MVAEAASKQPFAALLQQLVLTPAGLKHTFFDKDTLLIPNRAQGYAFSGGEFQRTRIWSMSIGVGIGNLVSTSGDLLLWDQALFHHGLLRPESLRAMTTPGITGYGFGVLLGDINGERFVSHGVLCRALPLGSILAEERHHGRNSLQFRAQSQLAS